MKRQPEPVLVLIPTLLPILPSPSHKGPAIVLF